jgi:multisubunit Na+/H+ antiporter MnhG subunit
MSKTVEIGSTLAVVAVFVAFLVAAGLTGAEKTGTVAAILAFVLLSSGAGYLIAQKTYS